VESLSVASAACGPDPHDAARSAVLCRGCPGAAPASGPATTPPDARAVCPAGSGTGLVRQPPFTNDKAAPTTGPYSHHRSQYWPDTGPAPSAGQYQARPPAYSPQAGTGYPQAYGNGAPAPGYGGYPQGYDGSGYPSPYGGSGYSGYGSNGPFSPFGFPGGANGFSPFSGNATNGRAPGFNLSPFGFF
jgi:hypothetical protein